ncbi:DUF4386 domain-containing protein [Methanococcoides alaskense]|uniref:Uncharacterized membrane protein YdcZ (DUF606 family) n=1 Tax=Methanococcoides alaskense TaxID=325778 RepID=A0AA90U120_9EURY|nr:DUF4386 domain-containing protein [Methanococcoides alaskense]MDA0524366.1 DUF4386 domain-containing protein [Methanococcoides alaskense]MDR6223906.1 uncharacterized membrane protein YdcZ (DUF606 family) [Methanococcoides alaskense]
MGVLFLLSTVAGVLSVAFLEPMLNAPDYLTNFSANENQVIIGALLELICAGAFLGIAVMIFPILKKHNERIALGYVVARICEAVPFVVGVISLLSLLTLSQEFVKVGAPYDPYFLPLGTLLLAVHDWTNLIGSMIVFSLTALILNYSLYRSKLFPQSISVWGLIGVPLMLAAGVLDMFGLDPFSTIGIFLAFPLALNEMVLAIWLIVKGFNSSALAEIIS